MTKRQIRLATANGTLEEVYAREVERRLRAKYTVSAELAILRQRDSKPEEFEAYNEYAEQCKAEAKAALEEEQ